MVLKWIQSVVTGSSLGAIGQGAEEERKKVRKLEGRDVAHEAMRLRSHRKSEELEGLVRLGMPQLERRRFTSCVKQQVFEMISKNLDIGGEPAEEITEKITGEIVDAAEADPTYRRMFSLDK